MKFTEDQEKLLDIAQKLSKWMQEENEKFPYHVNIIRELHDNENAHTRILMQLLRYVENGRYSILESFVKMICEVTGCSVDLEIKNPKIDSQHQFIDGYVYENSKYAIVIENKIWDAVDQKEQIDRYVEIAKKNVKDVSKIIVVYLTKNGNKKVSDYSLSEKTKAELDDRFIPIDYKNNIIPWLRDEVLPNCKVKEEYLRSAIHQYIDYLYEINGMQDYQIKAMENTKRRLFREEGMDSKNFNEIDDKLKQVNQLQKILNDEREKLVNTFLDRFIKISIEMLQELVPDTEWAYLKNEGWLQFRKKEWSRGVHFEWIPFGARRIFNENEYTFAFHIEGNKTLAERLPKNKKLQELSNSKENPFYSKTVHTKGVSLGLMDESQIRSYLKQVYEDDIKKIVEIVDEELLKIK